LVAIKEEDHVLVVPRSLGAHVFRVPAVLGYETIDTNIGGYRPTDHWQIP